MKANQLIKREIIQYYKGGKCRPMIEHRYYKNGHVVEVYLKSCGKKPFKILTLK